jgi:hypothetical protein
VVAYKNTIPPTAGDYASLPRATIIAVDLSFCVPDGKNENDYENRGILPDKMLYNIGLDAASSDLVFMVPLYGVLQYADDTATAVDGDNLLDLLSKEIIANPGYAVVFPIGRNTAPCSIADASGNTLAGLRPRPEGTGTGTDTDTGTGTGTGRGRQRAAELFDYGNQMVPIIFNVNASPHGHRAAR